MNYDTINRLNKAREHNSNYIPRRLFIRGLLLVLAFWFVVGLVVGIIILIEAVL